MSYITIDNVDYSIIDTKEKMTIPDCFVVDSNKVGTGHGEAKFYVGNDNESTRSFFGEDGFRIKCFLLKQDIVQYLKQIKVDYDNPDRLYRDRAKFSLLWNRRYEIVQLLPDVIWFNATEQAQLKGPRVYINSRDNAYNLIREISLPEITYISAMKLAGSDDSVVFYFRLFIERIDNDNSIIVDKEIREIEEKANIAPAKKDQILYARKGQGKYREALLSECPFCPVTLVSDDRLLIASHIKPWAASDEREKIDPKNGFMFTPTYDFLFDKGFITFSDDKKMQVSPWLSKVTCKKLELVDQKSYPMLPTEKREKYLKYHRANIFKQ